jgi:hypothetical protein
VRVKNGAVVKNPSFPEKGVSVRTKRFVCGLLPNLSHPPKAENMVCCTVGIECKTIEVYLWPSCRNQHVLPRFERQLKYRQGPYAFVCGLVANRKRSCKLAPDPATSLRTDRATLEVKLGTIGCEASPML